MGSTLGRQTKRFYRAFADLIRAYQFRDRDQSCGYGISISQCYALETLESAESVSMGELARALCLEPSTATRLMDQLVEKKLASRTKEASDRRVCRVQITPKGRALASRIHEDLQHEYEAVLKEIPGESREAVIDVVERLLTSYRARRRETSVGNKRT